MSKNHHLIQKFQQLKKDPRPIVLATITETFGSTYQKAGARMLIEQDGELTGLLGGGCFEHDLIEHARSVFTSGVAKTVFYDMRSEEDAVWGLGMGCNGAVRIFLQLLRKDQHFQPLNLIVEASDHHHSGLLVTICESAHPDFPVGHSLFLPSETVLAETEPFSLQILPEKSRLQLLTLGSQEIKAFYDRLHPPLQLLVLGAGVDAIPVVKFAKALGWAITVADHRPGYIDKQRFPDADGLLHLLPDELASYLKLQQFDAAVLMTHNLNYDQRFLEVLATSAINYIGLLGPAHRRKHLLEGLTGHTTAELQDKVYGPVGLDIGAETPEEIAISIVAGIQAARKGLSGDHLSRRLSADSLDQCN